MGNCYLCEKEVRESYLGYFCTKCRRIKHLLNLYNEAVYETLEQVLVRTQPQRDHKIRNIDTSKINNSVEDEKHEYYLRRDKKKLKNNSE